MALNGTEREDNFCHKSAVMWMVCDLPPVVETQACQATMLCPLGCPAHGAPLGAAADNALGWDSLVVFEGYLLRVGTALCSLPRLTALVPRRT